MAHGARRFMAGPLRYSLTGLVEVSHDRRLAWQGEKE